MKLAWRLSGLLLLMMLMALPRFSWGQLAEVAWQNTDNKFAGALYSQTDLAGNVYVVKQNPIQGSTYPISIDVYDPYGNFIRSFDDSGSVPATGLAVDGIAGTIAVSDVSGVNLFFWDGQSANDNDTGATSFLALGMDVLGRAIEVYTTATQTEVYGYAGGGGIGSFFYWSVPYVATSAQIDSAGNVLLTGATNSLNSGSVFADFYSEDGTLIWSRSFPTYFGHGVLIAGFVEDQFNNYNLVINNYGVQGADSWFVISINNQNTSQNAWQSTALPGLATIACDDEVQLAVAGQANDGQPFVAAISYAFTDGVTTFVGGTVNWNVTQNASLLASSYVAFGQPYVPVVAFYDSSSNSVKIQALSQSTGAVTSTISVPGTSSSDLGSLTTLDGGVNYVGSTGGSQPSAFIAQIVYGTNLQSVVLPATVQGGSNLAVQINLGGPSTYLGNNNFQLISSLPSVINSVASVGLSLTGTTTYSPPTLPVDADTPVTLAVAQSSYPYVERSATVTVKAAALASCTSSASSFNPSQTATGTVTLTGPAGPSGKTVTLSSSDPSITVPASVKVLAGKTSAAFIITCHPVSAETSPTITATLAGQNFATTVHVFPAPLKSLTVNPSSLQAGESTTGEVIIATEAGPSGDLVTIRSNMPALVAPSTVKIPAEGTYTTFPLKAGGVSASTVVTLSAIFNGITKFASVTVEPATLDGVDVSPSSLKGGETADATIFFTGPAGSSGFVVSLKSSSAALTVPASITVPAGSGSFSFLVKTKAVTTSTPVTITATLGAVTRTASITLTP